MDDLSEAWKAAQERLAEGWTLDSLRCASTGLEPAARSDDWVAVAVGPDGEERRFTAATALEALEGISQS